MLPTAEVIAAVGASVAAVLTLTAAADQTNGSRRQLQSIAKKKHCFYIVLPIPGVYV